MYSTAKSMSERLVSAKMALTNALAQEDIKNSMSEMGFDEARLNEGLVLYQQVEELYQLQRREYTEQYLASEALHEAWEEAQNEFRRHATAAKLALIDQPTLLSSLGFDGSRKFSIPDWVTMARTFYSTALQSTAIMESIAGYAVTAEKLQAGLQLVDKVEELRGKREIEKAEAQQATRERDKAFAQLDKYMYRFSKVARVVLEEKPEHLEKVGILYRSAPIRKKENGDSADEEPAPTLETTAGKVENKDEVLLEKI
ncbi:MAG: hypothetical protein PVH61_27575 [Candidatus Aminicenantes bacterium]|jgi:hypothetical protein